MPEAVKTWLVLDLIRLTESLFRDNGIDNPRLNAELLLADTLNLRRFDLYLNFDRPLGESELADYRSSVKRRIAREPLQYITGKAEFYGLPFEVNPAVLIPRPETELLVEKTLALLKEKNITNPRILEIGTGSGCISIAIACNIDCDIDAIDLSSEAFETALRNSAANNTKEKITFSRKDILKEPVDLDGYDIVISNPPYIPLEVFRKLEPELKNFEPAGALTDGGDGLLFYRKFFDLWNRSSKCKAMLLEIGDNRMSSVEALLKERQIADYTFQNDLLNLPRVLIIQR
jgi:release factor glutamine methyltransferase